MHSPTDPNRKTPPRRGISPCEGQLGCDGKGEAFKLLWLASLSSSHYVRKPTRQGKSTVTIFFFDTVVSTDPVSSGLHPALH